ncbi:GntR family transcriptional regulator [Nonomuraea ferruginea]
MRFLSAGQVARLVDAGPHARPYYRALADAMRAAVMGGQIPVRVRMPAERDLARTLGVSRTTVTAAYDLLRERGFLESRQGSGSWTALPDPAVTADNPWLAVDGEGLIQLHAAAPPAPSRAARGHGAGRRGGAQVRHGQRLPPARAARAARADRRPLHRARPGHPPGADPRHHRLAARHHGGARRAGQR